jgi:hypothetical protein
VRRLATLAGEAAGTDSTATPADTAASTARPAPSTAAKKRVVGDGNDEEENEKEPPARFDDRAMIEAAYPLLYGRPATAEEIELGLAFLGEQRTAHLEDEIKEAEERKAGKAEATPGRGDERAAITAVAARVGDLRGAASRPAAPEATAGASATDADGATADGSAADPDGELAARRASLAAWVQYARALFSAAEFRFID